MLPVKNKSKKLLFSLILLLSSKAFAIIEYKGETKDKKTENASAKTVAEPPKRESTYKFSSKFKPGDSFYGKNISLLNSSEDFDRIFYMRHTLDFTLDYSYGFAAASPAAQMRFSMRNKPKWGSLEIIPTTKSDVKILDTVNFSHQHYIPRHIFFIREAWLDICLNDVSGIDFGGKRQSLQLGFFPFKLGRGIALGDAYAVGADYLGFYSDTLVDQFAPGLKLSGDIIKDRLSYDIYGALLNNKMGGLGETGAKVFAQQYGKINCPERGFGICNTVFAGRLNITAFDREGKDSLTFEPYALFNDDREQFVEFLGDTSSKLGSIGLAGEYEGQRFECGFDGAINLGNQYVKGWDRNIITMQNINGRVCEVNDHVYVGVDPCSETASSVSNMDAYKAINAPTTETTSYQVNGAQVTTTTTVNKVGRNAKDMILNSDRDCRLNGKMIGTVSGYSDAVTMPVAVAPALKDQFYNAKDRFRDPYKNKYKGFMFVADGAVCFLEKDLKIAATAGYSSGDADPNNDIVDGDYRGFIPLQEAYSGLRVPSSFYMGGVGKLKRGIDTLSTDEKPSDFSSNIDGFTDLAFVGTGIKWCPKEVKKKFNINPNILGYWQTWPERKFDYTQGILLPERARRFLGTEMNIFMEKYIVQNLKVFLISSIFVPGVHYDDIKGKPINKDQQKRLDNTDVIGEDSDCVPNIGTDNAFAINVGFEYFF